MDTLTRWLAHPLPKGRAEAVRALRILGAATPERITSMLTDGSAAVTRQVARALLGHAIELDGQLLQDLVQPSRPRHVRVAAFRLLRDRDLWTRLKMDLRFIDDPELAVSSRARADIETWLRREAATAYVRPHGLEAGELRVATPPTWLRLVDW